MHGSDMVELERCDDLVEKHDLLRGGVDERHVEVGTHDLEGETGEPGSGSHVDQAKRAVCMLRTRTRETVELGDHGDCIQEEPPLDLFRVPDCRQVELRSSFKEKIPVASEARQ